MLKFFEISAQHGTRTNSFLCANQESSLVEFDFSLSAYLQPLGWRLPDKMMKSGQKTVSVIMNIVQSMPSFNKQSGRASE